MMNYKELIDLKDKNVVDAILVSIVFATVGLYNSSTHKCVPLSLKDSYSLQVYGVTFAVLSLVNAAKIHQSDKDLSWKEVGIQAVKESIIPFIAFLLISSLPLYETVDKVTRIVGVKVLADELNCCPTITGVALHTIVYYIVNVVANKTLHKSD